MAIDQWLRGSSVLALVFWWLSWIVPLVVLFWYTTKGMELLKLYRFFTTIGAPVDSIHYVRPPWILRFISYPFFYLLDIHIYLVTQCAVWCVGIIHTILALFVFWIVYVFRMLKFSRYIQIFALVLGLCCYDRDFELILVSTFFLSVPLSLRYIVHMLGQHYRNTRYLFRSRVSSRARVYIFDKKNPCSYMFYVTLIAFSFGTRYKFLSYRGAFMVSTLYLFCAVVFQLLFAPTPTPFTPASGMEEKEARRALFDRKSKGRSIYAKTSKYALQDTGSKIPKVVYKMSRKELDDIYKNFPKFEPCAGFMHQTFFDKVSVWWRSIYHGKEDKVIAFLESLAILSGNLIIAPTHKHRAGIIVQWIHSRYCTDVPMMRRCTEILGFFMKFSPVDLREAAECSFGAMGLAHSASLDPKGVSSPTLFPADGLDLGHLSGSDNCMLDNSDTIRRFKKMMQMFVDVGMCSIFGFECTRDFAPRTLETVGQAIKHLSLIEYVTGSVIFFVERGYAAYEKKSIRYLFFADEFADFEIEFRTVKVEVEALKFGFTTTHSSILKDDLVRRTKALKELAERRIKTLKGLEKSIMSERLGVILGLQQNLALQELKIGARRTPFSLLLFGDSGVGKSWVMQSMTPVLLKALNLPCTPNFIRYPNARDDYDTAIDNDTLALIIDDLANIKAPFCGGKSPVDTVLRIANNIVTPAVKAELREKGNIFINPWVFWASTNVKHLDAQTYSNNQLSILRRFNYTVIHKLDPAYMTNGTCDFSKWPQENKDLKIPPALYTVETVSSTGPPSGIDPAIGPDQPYGYSDKPVVWNVAVWDDRSDGVGGVKPDIVMKDVNFATLEGFCIEKARKHTESQTQYLDSLTQERDPTFCEHNVSVRSCSICARCSEALRPAADVEPRSPTSFDDYFHVLRRWYETFPQGRSARIEEVDMDEYKTAVEARMILANYQISRILPLNVLTRPIQLVITDEHEALQSAMGAEMDARAIGETYQYFKSARDYVDAAQVEDNEVEVEGLEEEVHRQARFSWWRELYLSPWCFASRVGRSYGWYTALCGIPLLAVGFTTAVWSMGASMIVTIPVSVFMNAYALLNFAGVLFGTKIQWIVDNYEWIQKSAHIMRQYSRKVLKKKYAAILAAVIVFAVAAKYISRSPTFEPQGSAVSVPEPQPFERTTTWVQGVPKVDLHGADLNYTNQPGELAQAIENSMVRIRIYPQHIKKVPPIIDDSNRPTGCGALLLHGGLVVVPNHLVNALGSGRLAQVLRGPPGSIINHGAWIVTSRSVYRVPGTDYAVLHTTSLGDVKDLDMYLPAKAVTTSLNVRMVMRMLDWSLVSGHAHARHMPMTKVESVGVYDGYNMNVIVDGHNMVSESGNCMAAFISSTSPSFLHSFYLAGAKDIVRSAPFLRGYAEDARMHFKTLGCTLIPASSNFDSGKGPLTDHKSAKSPISHVCKNSEPLYFDWLGSLSVVGSSRRFVGRVRDTPFAEHLEGVFGCTYKWASPINLGNWKPWYGNLVALGEKVSPWDPVLMDVAQKDLSDSLVNTCKEWNRNGKSFSDLIHPVSEKVAVNGVPGVAGMERVKLNTSAGWPLSCAKDKVFERVPSDEYPCGEELVPNAAIKEHMQHIEDCARRGVRSNVVFRACPKDEPTLPTKEKVRIFAGCPVAYLIAVRKMTFTLVKFMTDNHLLFNTVAGANCHGYDWTAIGLFLSAFSLDQFIAGDYSEYDKKMLADIMCRACEITLDMLRVAGYTPEQIDMTRNLILESCYPIYEWNGDFIRICGSNPSGQPLTIWMNNIGNKLYQRYVFYTYYDKCLKFAECVRTLVMGDDNIMAVKPGYELFNHTSMVEVLGHHGLVYTMADKTSTSVPFIGLEEASLLKRQFIWSEEFQVYLCPIEEKSIFRSLHSHMLMCGPGSVTMEEHCVMMVTNALTEWFYFGMDVYEDRLDKCNALLFIVGYHNYRLPTWGDQVQAFKKRIVESRCLQGVETNFSWSYEEKPDALEVELLYPCKDVQAFDSGDAQEHYVHLFC